MLYLARDRNLPVVLHCTDDGTGQAASKTLQVIKETGLTAFKYHRHCFTGTYEELLEWTSLPHVRFGATWKTVAGRASADSVARIETKEILLETDAHFLPPYPECKVNHPWNLEVVAQEVSRIRNVPLSMLMTTINQNTIQFYGLDSRR